MFRCFETIFSLYANYSVSKLAALIREQNRPRLTLSAYEPTDSSLCAQGILLINKILKRANL